MNLTTPQIEALERLERAGVWVPVQMLDPEAADALANQALAEKKPIATYRDSDEVHVWYRITQSGRDWLRENR